MQGFGHEWGNCSCQTIEPKPFDSIARLDSVVRRRNLVSDGEQTITSSGQRNMGNRLKEKNEANQSWW